MLLWNVNISLGLVNGSTGIIKEFIFDENIYAPSLPNCVIIDFLDYSGPAYFSGIGHEKWVPIDPETAKWGGVDDQDHFRKQFPLCLAWALTVWKSQGTYYDLLSWIHIRQIIYILSTRCIIHEIIV